MSFPAPEKLPLDIKMTLDGSPIGIPKPPVNAFYSATELDKQGKHKEAERIYLELLNADFENPILHAALGMCLASMERNGLAAILLRRAIDNIDGMPDGFKRLGIMPKATEPGALATFFNTKRAECLNALGTCYKHENNVPEARRYFHEAQAQIPLNADIQNNLGTLYINEGKPVNAIEHLDLALGINPNHPQASWNKSLAHLELGDYREGWNRYDAGFAAAVRAERNYGTTQIPVWNGEPGKTIIVYGEQGIGDEIMFASCLPDLLKVSKQVVFDCHKKLHTLFAEAWPDIDIYPTREDQQITWPVDAAGKPRYPFDARIAIGSLPKFFRPTLLSFPGTPYLKPNVAKEADWTVRLAKLGPRPKIGINWIGGHKRTRVEVRSTSLETLLPILKQDADFISLQYTDCVHEIQEFESKHGIKIHYFPEASHSPQYADCAALVANLDLVITVCTSVVHLSGAMGVPTWVLTPSRPAWRYRLDLDYLPWYSSVRLIRQAPDTTDWGPVIEKVSADLTDLIGAVNVQQ